MEELSRRGARNEQAKDSVWGLGGMIVFDDLTVGLRVGLGLVAGEPSRTKRSEDEEDDGLGMKGRWCVECGEYSGS